MPSINAPTAAKSLTPSHIEAIPLELRQERRWVLWRYETRTGDDKPTKVPYTIRGNRASSTNPKTWNSLGACLRYQDRYDGVGFVLGDGWAGVDLDNCVTDGQLNEQAQAMTGWLNSYAEVSPSGNGVKAIVKAQVPSGKKLPSIEVYGNGRYFTVTGQKLPDAPATIQQADLSGLLIDPEPTDDSYTGEGLTATDDEILTKAFSAKNGHKIKQLYDGDATAYSSRSEADLALASMLAFWTGRNAQQLTRILCNSGLHREKWHRKHFGDGRSYLQATVEKALTRNTYYSGKTEGSAQLDLHRAALDPALPIWHGKRGLNARRAYARLIDVAEAHGAETGQGISVSLSHRDWAQRAGVSLPTLRHLIQHLATHKLIRCLTATTGRYGTSKWLLTYEGVQVFHIHNQDSITVDVDCEASVTPPFHNSGDGENAVPLRNGGGKAGTRAGSYAELICQMLAHRSCRASELARMLGRQKASVSRKLRQLRDQWGVVARDDDWTWYLTGELSAVLHRIGLADGSYVSHVKYEWTYRMERDHYRRGRHKWRPTRRLVVKPVDLKQRPAKQPPVRRGGGATNGRVLRERDAQPGAPPC